MDWLCVRVARRQTARARLVTANSPTRQSQLSLVPARQELRQATRRSRIPVHHAPGGRLLETVSGSVRTHLEPFTVVAGYALPMLARKVETGAWVLKRLKSLR